MTRVLVAHKKSRLEVAREHDDESVERLLEAGDPSVSTWAAAHERHGHSLSLVHKTLDELELDYDSLHRADVEDAEGFELVIAVGGDGTVLDLSHRIDSVPLLGVNSDPQNSVGYFCATDASGFRDRLEQALDGSWEPFALNRFYVRINGERMGYPILNDVLIAHENPAAVTKAMVQVSRDGEPESQKSSGIWISTAAGSTAAIRSAGGYVMPLGSNDMQYLVREPCPPNVGAYKHLKGIRPVEDFFEIISRMRNGRIYLDGPHSTASFTIGDVLTIDGDAPALRVFGVEEKSRD